MSTFVMITLRSVIAYVVLLALTRLMGKREISQMTFFDYIVGITIGSITANMAIDTKTSWYSILPAVVIFSMLQIVSSYLSIKSVSFRKLVDGSSAILIDKGKVIKQNMLKSRVDIDELMAKLREKNAFNLADVETAILETDGNISVQLKTDKHPLTPTDMNIHPPYNGLPRLVIQDGSVIEEGLKDMKLTRTWLMSKLSEQNISDISKVTLAQVDTSGNLYVDLDEGSQGDHNSNTDRGI